MTTTIQPAGFLVCDDSAVLGFGATEQDAWDALRRTLQMDGIEIVEKRSEDFATAREQALIEDFECAPATAALLQDLEARGGRISWSLVNGVCCTNEEALDQAETSIQARQEA